MIAGLNRTLAEVIRKAISGELQDVHIALPGQVVRWDATKNLADVQVMVKHPLWDDDNNRTYEDLGVLLGVPVIFPRGGGYVMTWPLVAGDSGQLVFHSTPIGEWRTSGQSSSPADASRHSIGWPTFTPGLFPDTNPPNAGDATERAAGIVIGRDGQPEQILIQPGLISAGQPSAGALPLPTLADFATLYNAMSVLVASLSTAVSMANVSAAGGVAKGTLTGYTPAYTTLFKAK